MIIRKALYSDLDNVLFVERAAFGSDEEANLVRDLLGDDSAKPIVSLLAFQENRAVGHNKNADAWMVRSLRPEVIGTFSGKVICADKMNNPKYWRE